MAGSENEHLAGMRVEYGSIEKDRSSDLDADWLDGGWLALFRRWIDDAERAGVSEPNAFVLATVAAGRPVSRSVLCKSADETGITFFTNYDSAKGDELAATPYASATFPWFQLGRQVHLRGPVSKVDPQATEDYWSKRPARLTAGRVGVAPVAADRVARGVARATGRGDRAIRRLGERPGTAELGRLPHRARGGGVLAGPGKPGAQPDTGHRRPGGASSSADRSSACSLSLNPWMGW